MTRKNERPDSFGMGPRHGLRPCKGQLISKGLFGILNSHKKRTKKFDFTTMIPQVDLFSFVFWEKLKTPKRHFEIK